MVRPAEAIRVERLCGGICVFAEVHLRGVLAGVCRVAGVARVVSRWRRRHVVLRWWAPVRCRL
jgi:hypothetical protein